MNRDYHDVLQSLVDYDVRFLVVGAHALAAHGYPRSTVDIDIWVERSAENAKRVWNALAAFGAPLDALESDLTRPEVVAQFGLPPNRIDILTAVSGIEFEAAWQRRITEEVEGVRVALLGRDDLVANKSASGRDKDRVDIKGLQGEV